MTATTAITQETIRLTASDGHALDAWIARPAGAPRGAIVVAQEMYGVTDYLKRVAAFYAGQGYLAVTPALYDRRERGTVLPYDESARDRVHELYKSMDWELSLLDLDAARIAVQDAGKVAVIGFCWGGSLAWMAACRYPYDAAVAYYGSAMPDYAAEQPRCPVIGHVGELDTSFPPARVAQFGAAHPEVTIYGYAGAQHGFDNETRAARFHEDAHRLARERTLAFLAAYVG
ncbi:MAG TPA: dienelactone hydrolase family protein [Alphaproteobacteria bacterium]